ncbi:MAG: hypothetical protein OEY56_03445 [Cyclobacteriaceae bacterium]|nr:hypothetical protein [Cyclobacteriaceae bacterium]
MTAVLDSADIMLQTNPDRDQPDNWPSLDYKQIYWIDSSGHQQNKWCDTGHETAKINVGTRTYFTNILDGRGNLGDTANIESIFSWNTGEVEAVLSKKSNHPKYPAVAVAFHMPSIMNARLPYGCQFMLVDRQGLVHFHSNTALNLHENLLDETNQDQRLTASIEMEISSSISGLNYNGQQSHAYVLPQPGTPFTLVVIESDEASRSVNTQIFGMSLVVFIVYGSFGLGLLFLFRLMLWKNTKLLIRQFPFHWLRPNPLNADSYMLITLYLAVTFLFLIILYWIEPDTLSNILCYLLLSILTFTFIYFVIFKSQKNRDEKTEWVNTTKFLLTFSFIFILLLLITFLSGSWLVVISLLLWLATASVFYEVDVYASFPERLNKFFEINYRSVYNTMLFLWLLNTGIMPAIVTYRTLYNHEHDLLVKYKLSEVMRTTGRDTANQVAYDILMRNSWFEEIQPGEWTRHPEMQAWKLERLFQQIRPAYNELMIKTGQLFEANDTTRWQLSDNKIQMKVGSYFSPKLLTARVSHYSFPNLFSLDGSQLVFSLLLGVLLIGFYALLNAIVNRLFVLPQMKENFFSEEYVAKMLLDPDKKRLLLIGFPGSKKRTIIKQVLKKQNVHYVEAREITTEGYFEANRVSIRKKEFLVVFGLDYFFHTPGQTDIMMEFFEKALAIEGLQIILTSAVDLDRIITASTSGHQLFSSFYTLIIRLSNRKNKAITEHEAVVEKKYFFDDLLNGLKSIWTTTPKPREETESQKNDCFDPMIRNELDASHFLSKLKERISHWLKENEESWKDDPVMFHDSLILHIQAVAKGYYQALWKCCTPEERFVVYDLAKNLCVNHKNIEVINALLAKGMFVQKEATGRLVLMNMSFRNFVLSISSQEEILLQLGSKTTKSWQAYKSALLIIILALAAFLFISEKETYHLILATLTSILGGVPLVLQLINLFGGKGK